MAIVAPVLVTVLLGQIEASRLGMVAQVLTTAAREGCRVAVTPGATQTGVQNRINAVLSGSGISVGTITPTCPSPYTWNNAPDGTPITITMSVPYSQVSWLGTPYFLTNVNINAQATMSSESGMTP